MGVGRKKKPTHLKVVEGNPGKRALPQNEPKPSGAVPEKPSFSTEEASECYDRMTNELKIMGLLHAADVDSIEIYCETFGVWRRAQRAVARGVLVNRGTEDRPNWVTNPAWRIARDAAGLLKQLAEQFGLTPAARARIEVPEPDFDDLDQFLA
jgi:P27 family predicted phage terminase small subunit